MALEDELRASEPVGVMVERLSELLGPGTDFDNHGFMIKRGNLRTILAALTERKAPVEVEGLVERFFGELEKRHYLYSGAVREALIEALKAALATELATLKQQLAEREEAIRRFLAKFDECKPNLDSAFFMAFDRMGTSYDGPQFGEELEALRALTRTDGGDQ